MIRSSIRLVAPLALTLAARADTIHLVGDNPLPDVEIVEETLTTVTYEQGGRLQNVPSERVERVEYSRLPRDVDQAEAAARDGDLGIALDILQEYLVGIAEGERERREWAPAYAAKRALDLQRSLEDLEGILAAADRLIDDYSESRYVPLAYLAKADALALSGSRERANATLEEFAELIESQGLAQRWQLECDLALILTDASRSGAARREALEQIASTAGDQHPGVRNRARVALAEGLVAAATSGGADAAKLAEARSIFREVTEDPFAAPDVLAAAYTGLGDCLFWTQGNDEERLYEAGMSYMRVAVLYHEHSRYVAKAMFYAGRCFDQLDDPEHQSKARKLYRTVLVEFPNSEWAAEAKNFL